MAKTKLTNKPGPKLNGTRKYRNRHDVAREIGKYLGDGTFEVDKNPPPMAGRFSHPEIIAFKEKLKMSAEATPVDKAFIIPAIGSGIAKKYLHDTFEKFRFVVNNIIGNDKMVRVYKNKRVVK
jgi:hypothetical protein